MRALASDPPPTLTDVRRSLQVSMAALHKYAPDLTQQLSERLRVYRTQIVRQQRALLLKMCSETPPVPLPEVERRVGMKLNNLRYYHRGLLQRLFARWRRYRAAQRKKRVAQLVPEVYEIVKDRLAKGQGIALEKIAADLSNYTYQWGDKQLRLALDKALKRLEAEEWRGKKRAA